MDQGVSAPCSSLESQMVVFRCKRSGNFVSFNNEDDIKQLRAHESYEEVKDEANADEAIEIPQAPEAEVLKKRGRPRKDAVTEI